MYDVNQVFVTKITFSKPAAEQTVALGGLGKLGSAMAVVKIF